MRHAANGALLPPQAGASPSPVTELFVATWERDICQLHLMARALGRFDALARVVGDVHIEWVSQKEPRPNAKHLRRIAVIGRELGTSRSLHFSVRPDVVGMRGWRRQQAAKLEASLRVRSPYYLVLDSKSIPVRPLGPLTLFGASGVPRQSDWKAISRTQMASPWTPGSTGPHVGWVRESAKVLGIDLQPWLTDPASLYLPNSVTPAMLRTQTARDLVATLRRRFNTSGLEPVFEDRNNNLEAIPTEFCLYYLSEARRVGPAQWQAMARDNFLAYTVWEPQIAPAQLFSREGTLTAKGRRMLQRLQNVSSAPSSTFASPDFFGWHYPIFNQEFLATRNFFGNGRAEVQRAIVDVMVGAGLVRSSDNHTDIACACDEAVGTGRIPAERCVLDP